jgi:hypothetical protein
MSYATALAFRRSHARRGNVTICALPSVIIVKEGVKSPLRDPNEAPHRARQRDNSQVEVLLMRRNTMSGSPTIDRAASGAENRRLAGKIAKS